MAVIEPYPVVAEVPVAYTPKHNTRMTCVFVSTEPFLLIYAVREGDWIECFLCKAVVTWSAVSQTI